MELPLAHRDQRFTLLAGGKDLQLCALANQPVAQRDPRGKGLAVRLCQVSGYADIVDLVHMFFWRKQLMRQRAVIRQQQQTFSILVQPTYRKQTAAAVFLRQQIQYCPTVPVLCRREHAGRLMHHEIGMALIAQRFSVDEDLRRLRVVLLLSRAGDRPVDQHPSFPDQLLDLAPGPVPH